MNSTLILGVASIGLALVFRSQGENLPAVALRLPSFLKRRAARRAGATSPVAEDDEPIPPIIWAVLCLFGAAIVGYVALIPYLGYLITTPLFITGALLVAKAVRPLTAVMVGGFTTAFVWAVFIWALGLPVPLLPFLK